MLLYKANLQVYIDASGIKKTEMNFRVLLSSLDHFISSESTDSKSPAIKEAAFLLLLLLLKGPYA